MKRLLNILYVLDCLALMLLTLGNAKIGETISSVAWVLEQDGKWLGRILRPVIDTLLWFDDNHCAEAWVTYKNITGKTR